MPGRRGPDGRLIAGAGIMLAAICLQFAMLIRLLEPSLLLGLVGYVALFIGMGIAVMAFVARR